MTHLKQHCILIGFKSTGKSSIGRALAHQLKAPFIDTDHQLEQEYEKRFQVKATCRQIMQEKGEAFFRALELEILATVCQAPPAIIALGGGTPLSQQAQALLKGQDLVHITAPAMIVFSRLCVNGIPAFFNHQESPIITFQRLWEARRTLYEKIRTDTIENHDTIDTAVARLYQRLS